MRNLSRSEQPNGELEGAVKVCKAMSHTTPLELALVVPTLNEEANIAPLLNAVEESLRGIQYEIIFVDDDSQDDTAAVLRAIGRTDRRIRILQRVGRRGLASASLEGMLATAAPYIAVMDADLQHDERILPVMLARLKSEGLDLVVATRNKKSGGLSPRRVRLSQWGRRLSKIVSKTDLNDPLSGFFILDRRFLEEVVHSASGVGFKVLLDLVASSRRPLRFAEVSYEFRERLHGTSKLDGVVAIEYLQLLLDKLAGGVVPTRFFVFSMVGAVGFLLSVAVLDLLVVVLGVEFFAAQVCTAVFTMTMNFLLNNSLTYRDRRLRGSRLVTGLVTFYAACLVGLVINVRLAQFARSVGLPWYVAGPAGLAVGAVWNYGVTSLITWREERQRTSGALSRRRESRSSL